MKAELPAEGILKTNDFGDAKFYKVCCQCGDPDCEINFEVEADNYSVSVNTYVDVKTNFWKNTFDLRYDIDNRLYQEFDWFWKNLANNFIRRVKWTWSIWTQGYVRAEATILMSEQQALNYAETLKMAINDVKNFKKSR